MNTPVDRLDAAIDAVAGRLTHVNEDVGLGLRIAKALPQRPAGSLHWLMPRLAVTAVLAMAMAMVILRTFDEGPANVLRTEGAPTKTVEPASNGRRTLVEPALTVRRTIEEPASNDLGTLSEGDHEFSLAPIDPPDTLLLTALTPSELASEPVQEIEPLQIADLPLSLDVSPR